MSPHGTLGYCARKSSLKAFADSPMISSKRSTAVAVDDPCPMPLVRLLRHPGSGWRRRGCPASSARHCGSQVYRLAKNMLVSVFEAPRRHNVDWVPEEFLKFSGHPHQVEQRTVLVEINQQVDVAIWCVIAARDRAIQANPIRVMPCGNGYDLLTLGCYQPTQRRHLPSPRSRRPKGSLLA